MTAVRTTVDFDSWPYPLWVAHRGAGLLAPENTLAAFDVGARHGYRMFECDVKLSSDGVLFLLHDDGLERTTDGIGLAGDLTWGELCRLDAGSWHSPSFRGEPLPTFAAVAEWAQTHDVLLDVEIKPTLGAEADTGHAVAAACADAWPAAAVPPLLTSFQVASLEAARERAPDLPRGLLIGELRPGWLQTAQALGCVAVVVKHTLVNAELLVSAHAAGMRVGVYTANRLQDVARVRSLGVDMIVTDAVDVHRPT